MWVCASVLQHSKYWKLTDSEQNSQNALKVIYKDYYVSEEASNKVASFFSNYLLLTEKVNNG